MHTSNAGRAGLGWVVFWAEGKHSVAPAFLPTLLPSPFVATLPSLMEQLVISSSRLLRRMPASPPHQFLPAVQLSSFTSLASLGSTRVVRPLSSSRLRGVECLRDQARAGFSGQRAGEFSIQRRTFVRNCVAAWLVACTAAMADTAMGEPGSKGKDVASTAVGTVVFYNYPLAFNPAKAKLALEEKGIKYVEKQIDLFNGQSLEPWYIKLNPSASSPTLVAGPTVIPESMDIIKWADQQGDPLGGDTVDRVFVDEWLSKVDAWDGNLFAAANSPAGAALKVGTKFKIKVAEANSKKNPELAETYQSKIVSFNKVLEEPGDNVKVESNRKQLVALLDEAETRLSTSKFMAGEQYSAADAIFTPVIYRLFLVKKDSEFLGTRNNIKRYYQEVKKRPSYKKVFSVSDSGFATATTVLPALGKILFSKLTGRY